MKKSLIAGVASLAFAATPVLGVFAEAPQASNANGDMVGAHDVTVDEVDETVYSVDINWGDMAFDWKYNDSTNTFSFAKKYTCTAVGVGSSGGEDPDTFPSSDNLFQDDACTEPVTVPSSASSFYAKLSNLSTIDVTDSTVNGRVKAKASFSPEDNYSWVTGKFSSIAHVDNNNTFSQDLDNGYLEAVAAGQGSRLLNGVLYLEGDNTHVTSDAVHAGDKIGTVTITIEPDLN